MDLLNLIGAFGLGSVVTALAQSLLRLIESKRALRFSERKEAYVGLWSAMHRSETERTEAAALNVGHWVARCHLVAPPDVRSAADGLIDTKPGTPERQLCVKQLLSAMRADLGIS